MTLKKENPSVREIAVAYSNKVWNDKDLNAFDELVDCDIVIHSLLGDFLGSTALKEVVRAWLQGFPDLRVYNDKVICENDVVCIHWQAEGTHQGTFKGKNPTGKFITYSGVTLYRIKNGKIIEYWAYLDMQHLMSQL